MLGHDHPQRLPVLNLHWVLGLLVGLLLIPTDRLAAARAACQRGPRHAAGAPPGALRAPVAVCLDAGDAAHRLRRHPPAHRLRPFVVPSFKDTALFAWISQTWNLNWEAFEKPFDAVHRVVGCG